MNVLQTVIIFCVIKLLIPLALSGYKLRCPESLELNIRSTHFKICQPENYHCLRVDDIKYDGFTEECINPEWITYGHYPTLRGRYIDYESCSANTYQPEIYWSNEQHKCRYRKSLCSGEGLLDFNSGNATIDRACRCDYTKGYKFVIRPKYGCFCVPSEEDCSCFLHSCGKQAKLNPDYMCVSMESSKDGTECPSVTLKAPKPTVTLDINNVVIENESERNNTTDPLTMAFLIGLITIIVLIIGCSVILFGISIKDDKKVIASQFPPLHDGNNEPTTRQQDEQMKFQDDKKATPLQLPPLHGGNNPLHGGNNEPTTRQQDEQMKFQGGNNESTDHKNKDNKALADFFQSITILHVEKDEKVVVDFKLDLQRLLDEIGLRDIEIILYKKKPSTDMDKLLQKGSIVFVYITTNVVPAKIEELGFDQKFAEDACYKGENVYHNVKTVINDDINFKRERLRNDFDYYEKSDEQRKKMLLALLQDIYQSST